MSKTPIYRAWASMHDRCRNPRGPKYRIYGGRGISVCERWKSFENFIADMGPRPEGMSLDRIDPDGNYEPENCRWATAKQQRHNRSSKLIGSRPSVDEKLRRRFSEQKERP